LNFDFDLDLFGSEAGVAVALERPQTSTVSTESSQRLHCQLPNVVSGST